MVGNKKRLKRKEKRDERIKGKKKRNMIIPEMLRQRLRNWRTA